MFDDVYYVKCKNSTLRTTADLQRKKENFTAAGNFKKNFHEMVILGKKLVHGGNFSKDYS